jgi:hypothetical protein
MNIDHAAAAAQGDEVDRFFGEYRRMIAHKTEPVARSKGGKVPIALILCICSWSVFETWAEIGSDTDNLQLCVLLVAKLIWLHVGGAAICNIRAGRIVFAFLCGVSVLAVAPALPSEYVISKTIFILLLVECVLKTAYLITLCGSTPQASRTGPHTVVVQGTSAVPQYQTWKSSGTQWPSEHVPDMEINNG